MNLWAGVPQWNLGTERIGTMVDDTPAAPRVAEDKESGARILLRAARGEFEKVLRSCEAGENRLRATLVQVMRLWEYSEGNAANAHEIDELLEHHGIFRQAKWKTDPFTPLLKLVCGEEKQHKANISRWADALKDARLHNVGSEQLANYFTEHGLTKGAKREKVRRDEETQDSERKQRASAAFDLALEER